uniref:Medium-chain acyl-CoA ligase ACSF2, mitochondrial n=1 Tax=Leptobrachium leishanense TaxID=445787 RepID=A0A8C5QZQ5_9ANUR
MLKGERHLGTRVFSFLSCLLTTRRPRHGGVRGRHVPNPVPPLLTTVLPVTSTSYVHGTSQLPLTSRTVHQCLADTTNQRPDHEALVVVHSGIRKTFSQLSQDVETLAAGLLALGLKKGDRLGMWGPNSYEWILMQYATAQAGIILVSVNPAYQPMELEFVLKKVGCSALVFPSQFKSQEYYEMLKQICPEVENSEAGCIKSKMLPDLRTVIVLDKKYSGTFHFQEVMESGSISYVQQLHDLQKTLTCDEPINIQFTSGTTGNPKGATLSHHNIVNNATLAGWRLGVAWMEGVRIALPAPLYHCLGSVVGSLVMAVYGLTLVLPSPGYDARCLLEAISQERCTCMYGTPTMFIDLLGQPDFAAYTSTLTSGKRLQTTFFAFLRSQIGYGTTENSPVTFMGFPHDDLIRKTETVGHVLSHTEAKIVNPSTDQIVSLDVPGELLIRGYCVMLHYWGEPEKTREAITPERWYRTGDIACLDSYGYCKIVGRCKDLIIRGGENVYPAEIEAFLHTHPSIKEAQVVGVKDQRMGEEICACIKLVQNEELSAADIRNYCKGKISHFKIPRYIEFVDEYPLTISGKVKETWKL